MAYNALVSSFSNCISFGVEKLQKESSEGRKSYLLFKQALGDQTDFSRPESLAVIEKFLVESRDDHLQKHPRYIYTTNNIS